MVLFFDARRGTARRETMMPSETVTFLDIQVNHITKDVGHINNKVLSKNASKIRIFWVMQAVGTGFFLFLLQIYNR